MLKISQVNYTRYLHNRGCRISEITRETGIDPKTIRKYISKDYFSKKPPIKTTHQSIFDEHNFLFIYRQVSNGSIKLYVIL